MCVYKTSDGLCRNFSDAVHTAYCVEGPCPHDKPSNADRIRAMSDEELAKIIAADCLDERLHFCQNKTGCYDILDRGECVPEELCVRCVMDWLTQPVEEDSHGT